MADFFKNMNEVYVRKHFPNGSVFDGALKTVKRISIVSIIFLAVFLGGALFGLLWAIGRTMELRAEGRDDMLDVSLVICGFLGLVVLGCMVVLVFIILGLRKKREDYIATSAKNSKLPVNEIEAFEQQAVAPDCFILKLTAGLDRLLSNSTNKDGLLTRDYIYLADPAQTVLRVDTLKACCFTDYTYYANTGKHRKKIHCLAIFLTASNGVSVLSDTTKKAGEALIALLKERNPAIDTNGGRVVPESALDDYKKRILGEQ